MVTMLERVVSVKQTSMAATALPLELQQQVYSFLDTRSFYAARKVCRWWRFASLDAVTLSHQLKHLPILPPVDAAVSTPAELQKLFAEAARTLLLGTRMERLHDTPGCFATATTRSLTNSPRWTANGAGDRTVTLNDRIISLFDTSSQQPKLLVQRRLNDLKETVGSGPWLKVTPSSSNVLALSSDGHLLAVAQERTVQIYDLTAEPDSFTVNQHIASAAGHYICGLDFEQDDHVLRVGLSGRGMVLYVGTPSQNAADGQGKKEEEKTKKATIEHWKSKAGLRHTFLDSALLALPAADSDAPEQVARVSGLQLLRPFRHGYLFAAQKHGGGESSHYVLGHVRTSVPHHGGALTAEAESVVLLAKLESFLSGWDYTLSGHSDSGLGLWENMPSAHEHHPRFVLSDDGSLLGLAERDKKRIRPMPLTQLFVYRLPCEKQLLRTFEVEEKLRGKRDEAVTTTVHQFLDRLERNASVKPASDRHPKSPKYRVPHIPLCLSTVQGEVTNLTFRRVDGNSNALIATTVETTRNWLLTDF